MARSMAGSWVKSTSLASSRATLISAGSPRLPPPPLPPPPSPPAAACASCDMARDALNASCSSASPPPPPPPPPAAATPTESPPPLLGKKDRAAWDGTPTRPPADAPTPGGPSRLHLATPPACGSPPDVDTRRAPAAWAGWPRPKDARRLAAPPPTPAASRWSSAPRKRGLVTGAWAVAAEDMPLASAARSSWSRASSSPAVRARIRGSAAPLLPPGARLAAPAAVLARPRAPARADDCAPACAGAPHATLLAKRRLPRAALGSAGMRPLAAALRRCWAARCEAVARRAE
mmetsp:Transcript_19337/g.74156  ORF Transcript_19337/g.74156 Transcript_19337/m.74156 type:complete len:290 (-) Transcript_19337:762-1631(-)